MYQFTSNSQTIEMDSFMKPVLSDHYSFDVRAAFLSCARPFPLGTIEQLTETPTLDTPALYFDNKHSIFFAATINLLLDVHAAHLDAEAREKQRKAENARYYATIRMKQHGASYAQRHAETVARFVKDRMAQIIAAAAPRSQVVPFDSLTCHNHPCR